MTEYVGKHFKNKYLNDKGKCNILWGFIEEIDEEENKDKNDWTDENRREKIWSLIENDVGWEGTIALVNEYHFFIALALYKYTYKKEYQINWDREVQDIYDDLAYLIILTHYKLSDNKHFGE